MHSALSCAGVGHHYHPGASVLDGIDLTLDSGVIGLVGVNGAGKSTLLQILAGSLRPSTGTVHLGSADLYGRGRRTALRRVAMMPQDFRFPGDVRVRDALRYCGWLRGLDTAAAVTRTDVVLEAVGLADRAGDRLGSLSGGMVRRIALAQALIAEPEVLLLDEPTTGLDPEQRVAVRALISETAPARTVVMSSHVMEDLEQLADRIVVLDAGVVLRDSSMEAFLDDHGGAERSAEAAFLQVLVSNRAAR